MLSHHPNIRQRYLKIENHKILGWISTIVTELPSFSLLSWSPQIRFVESFDPLPFPNNLPPYNYECICKVHFTNLFSLGINPKLGLGNPSLSAPLWREWKRTRPGSYAQIMDDLQSSSLPDRYMIEVNRSENNGPMRRGMTLKSTNEILGMIT